MSFEVAVSCGDLGTIREGDIEFWAVRGDPKAPGQFAEGVQGEWDRGREERRTKLSEVTVNSLILTSKTWLIAWEQERKG